MIGLKYLYAMLAGAFSGQSALNLRGQSALNLRGRRPTGSDLRNPADEYQSYAIEAAKLKRYRKARKAEDHHNRSCGNNNAHRRGITLNLNLNPFYIAK